MTAGRNQIIDDIITVIKASTMTNLANVLDDAIRYGLRTFNYLKNVQFDKGIFVGLDHGPMDPFTVSQKYELRQKVVFQVFVKGYDPETDQRLVVDIAEEIEQEAYTNDQITLASGGDQMESVDFFIGPPTESGNLTLHWAVVTITVRKIVNYPLT